MSIQCLLFINLAIEIFLIELKAQHPRFRFANFRIFGGQNIAYVRCSAKPIGAPQQRCVRGRNFCTGTNNGGPPQRNNCIRFRFCRGLTGKTVNSSGPLSSLLIFLSFRSPQAERPRTIAKQSVNAGFISLLQLFKADLAHCNTKVTWRFSGRQKSPCPLRQ